MPPTAFVDRDAPRDALRELLTRPGPSLALVYGRRRVGKTFLLSHTWPDSQTFYFVAADTTAAVNRVELLDAVARHFNLELDPADFPTWRTVFRLLVDLPTPKVGPLAVVLDEFQYLVDGDPSLPSQLAAVLDVTRDRRPFVLALSGSVVRTMEQLAAGGAPLYGRLSTTLRLDPFDYWDAAEMVPFADARTKAIAYGLYGGTPRYLASLRGDRSFADNVAADVLAPNGQVRLQVESVIDQERGLRNAEAYNAVLRAVGRGRTLANDIAQFAGLETGTALRSVLDTLVDLSYLTTHRNLDAPRNAPYRYGLADPALRFQAAVVSRYRSELATSEPQAVWRAYVERQIDQYMGLVFERMAEQAYHRLRESRDLPMLEQWGRWEGTDRAGTPREIDIVARLSDGRMMTGAVKWGVLDGSVHIRHLRDLEALAESGRAWAHAALESNAPLIYVTGAGFALDVAAVMQASGHPVVTWTLDDLYGPRPPRRRSSRPSRRA